TAADEYLRRNPDATCAVGDIARGPLAEPADLAVCLDLLIHLSDGNSYRDAVRNVLASGRVAAVISGYDDRPLEVSSLVFFHEPLLSTVAETRDVAAFPVLAYRGLIVYVALRFQAGCNTRDATAETIQRAMPMSPDPW